MNEISNANPHALLTCFFEECESQFRFLEEEHGYLYISGLMDYNRSFKVIRPYNKRYEAGKAFQAVTRYERNQQAIEIYYGDKNYALDIYFYPDSVQRFRFSELMSALRKDATPPRDFNFLLHSEIISESLQWFSSTMRQTPNLVKPSDRLINRAATMRDTLLEQSIRAHYEKLMKEASDRAAKAFARQHFGEVIEILSPYEDHLPSADLKKLQIARQKLS